MAKLNGVKTLDMVNGEITKVAYEGAEYMKTDEPVKEGDLFQLRKGHSVIGGEIEAFYRTYKDSDGDILIPTSAGGLASNVQRKGYGVAFRKISTVEQSKPTLEQRVETLESDVAALKSSDSSLKGEKVVEEPKRLTIWDKAKIVGNVSLHSGGIGDIVTIIEDAKDEQPYRCERISDGKDVGWFYEEDLVAYNEETIEFEGATYRKVEREAREGDVVTYASPSKSYVTKGKPYKVLSTDHGLRILDEDGDKLGVYNEWCRTRETIDVYEPIEQAKYVPKEGDIVVITGNTNMSRNKVGDIGKIRQTRMAGTKGAWVDVPQRPDSSDAYGNYTKLEEFRKATPAEVEKYEQAVKDVEIAEIKEKWAKIGRKPNEFKKGDVVYAKRPNYEGIGAIEDIGRSGYGVRFSNGDYKGFFSDEEGTVELVAPVESLFNMHDA